MKYLKISITTIFFGLINLLLCFVAFGDSSESDFSPRFASLRSNEVNLRTGPGVRYPVEWVFYRKQLPIKIIRNFGTWRLIRDWEGAQGWVHQSTLIKKRTLVVTGKTRTLRKSPSTESKAVAKLEDGVIAELKFCPSQSGWCRVETHGLTGWLRRAEFWGVDTNEEVK